MDPIYLHAKRINARFLAILDVAKHEEDEDLRIEASDLIAKWPKTHTFCIKNDEDALRVTWAKVFTGEGDKKGDTFSKKEGKKVAQLKMERFSSSPPRTSLTLDQYNAITLAEYEADPIGLRSFFFEHLPACVADTLPWYLSRAVRYFKIDNAKKVIIEASAEKVTWRVYTEQRKRISLISNSADIIEMLE